MRSLFLLPMMVLAAWSCTGGLGDGSRLDDGSPCSTVYQSECGVACTQDQDCAQGLYCDFGACSADCTVDGRQCASGSCSERGRCQGGMGGGDIGFTTSSGGSGGSGSGQGGACGTVEVEFEPQTPTVVLLIDQSGSMTSTFGGQPRWDVVYDVLMNPVDGVVQQLESFVRFGLALYTYSSGPTCPQLTDVMPPALNNHAAIDAVYAPASPASDTPTGDSLEVVAGQLAMFNEPGPKLIILATDGEPDRCEDPDGHDAISQQEAIDAATAAYAQGIETVIIAVGNQVSQQHQQDMANAGSGRPVPAMFPCNPMTDPVNCAPTYEPATKQEMVNTFLNIINGQRTCVFTLNGQVVSGKECDGDVKINGMSVPCNDPNGYQLNSPSEIEFLGTACDTIMNDPNVVVSAEFPCESIIVPE